MTTLKIALAQLNPTVGAISKNLDKAFTAIQEAEKNKADILVLPECFLSGYPAEDLILKPLFLNKLQEAVTSLIEKTKNLNVAFVLTSPLLDGDKKHNGALFVHQGKILARFYKRELPNYGVFDEVRVFDKGDFYDPITFKGVKIGIPICEDIWFPHVIAHYKKQGAELIISPNASPFETRKTVKRDVNVKQRTEESGLPIIYLNQVGGQDELVFDGSSFVMDEHGHVVFQMKSFEEEIAYTTWEKKNNTIECKTTNKLEDNYLKNLYQALVLGLRDYCQKNGFKKTVLGLSGGVDSALVAAIAVDALGSENVLTLMLPSNYTSDESFKDAKECAEALGIEYDIVSIKPAMDAFASMLTNYLDDKKGIAEENIQSRSRGLLLMALSNKHGHMLLSTGNKSEYATGYATLYGDMCGGFAVIKDVYKTTVFELCRWRNQNNPPIGKGPSGVVIPDNIITKPPTAELRDNQKDEDSLPPYPVLDGILRGLIEEEKDVDTLIKQGYERNIIIDVWKLLDRAEYKRRQAAPGVKLTSRAFGKERRYPITNGFISEMK